VPSLKQCGLGGKVLRFEEITKANSDEAKVLQGAQKNALRQRKRNGRQVFAAGRRRRRRVTAGADLEFRSLQFQHHRSGNAGFFTRRGRGQFGKSAGHRFRLGEGNVNVAFERVFRGDGLRRPVGYDRALIDTAHQFVETDAVNYMDLFPGKILLDDQGDVLTMTTIAHVSVREGFGAACRTWCTASSKRTSLEASTPRALTT
jgi:hypothetical protein